MPDLSLILRPILRSAAALVLMLAASPSMAFQLHIPQYTGVPVMISAGVVNRLTLESSLRPITDREEEGDDRTAPAPVARQGTIVMGRPGAYAKKLAQTYPGDRQAEAERLFRELLAGYQAIEDRFKIPRNDLSGSLAAFVAGSYMAYRGVDFPDAHFKPLVALKQRPDPATQSRLREAARSYLEGFLKVDAQRVQITADGLALR